MDRTAMIVDCAAYADGRRVSDRLDYDEVSEWLAKPGVFVWLGLRMPDRDEMARVAQLFGLDDLDVDAAVAPHRRPVLDRVGDATWLVLRTAQYHDKLEQLLLGELCVLFNPRFVITVRYGQATPLNGVRRELESDPDLLRWGVPAVLTKIVERVVDDYGPALDGFESDVLEVEDEVFSESRHRPTKRLYRLKREILELQIVTDALHDPLERALRTNPMVQEPAVHSELAIVVDQLARIVTRARTLADLVTTAIDANMTQVSLQQNNDMRKISAWVAIAAVPTMVAGVYGMNFEHMPELRWTFGYPLVLVLMTLTCALLYRAFRRSGWL
jgi:magnesium transporter